MQYTVTTKLKFEQVKGCELKYILAADILERAPHHLHPRSIGD